ncbi:hypothetical protein DNTS_003656 [Danionella cerebrum]|uniref:Active regulator of SIRT1 n=1 Tax=Danionella cerebrum TaxID=2873325 RepID=A0A553MQS3_9TELE|nr:hypothetical protein DNTS_003656 [Danionella translucida]
MSASVIRRGLELFVEKGKPRQKHNSTRKPTVMDQVSTDKQHLHKRIRQIQRGTKRQQSKNTVKDKKIHCVLDAYRKKQKKSQLSTNLQYFLNSDYKTGGSNSTKVQQQSAGRRSSHQPDLPQPRAEEKPIFTEKEFEKFQKEYFSKL